MDRAARIIGRAMSLNIPILIDKYMCQDCHIKARIKALPTDDVTDIMATIGSGSPIITRILYTFFIQNFSKCKYFEKLSNVKTIPAQCRINLIPTIVPNIPTTTLAPT